MRTALILLTGLMLLAAPTALAQRDEICQNGQLTYTNQTGAEQTIYATVYDADSNETISDSRTVTTLAPGESFDDEISLDAPEDDDVVVIYTTQPLDDDTRNPNFFDRSDVDPCFVFNDGRLNGHDAAAPAIVYNINNAFIDIYAVNPANGDGTRWLNVPYPQIEAALAVAVETGENQLIEENGHIALYALSAGTCQMNVVTSSWYVFEWACVAQ